MPLRLTIFSMALEERARCSHAFSDARAAASSLAMDGTWKYNLTTVHAAQTSRLGGAEGGILTISLLALLVADTVALEIGDRLLARGRHRKVVEFWGELLRCCFPALCKRVDAGFCYFEAICAWKG